MSLAQEMLRAGLNQMFLQGWLTWDTAMYLQSNAERNSEETHVAEGIVNVLCKVAYNISVNSLAVNVLGPPTVEM